MKKVLFIIALAILGNLNAQQDEAYVNMEVEMFVSSLKERGIDQMFYTQRFCMGEIQIIDLGNGKICATKGTYVETYLFWREPDSREMMKKIDNCGLFTSIDISDSAVYDYAISNWNEITTNKVKGYEMATESDGPTLRTELHRCKRGFTFIHNNDMFSNDYSLFDLTNEAEQANLNAAYNNDLDVVKLDKMIDKVLSDKSNSMFRQKR